MRALALVLALAACTPAVALEDAPAGDAGPATEPAPEPAPECYTPSAEWRSTAPEGWATAWLRAWAAWGVEPPDLAEDCAYALGVHPVTEDWPHIASYREGRGFLVRADYLAKAASYAETCGRGQLMLEAILIHEIGHALGQHKHTDSGVMRARYPESCEVYYPTPWEIETIAGVTL